MNPDCANCGGSPMGEGCYHICYNSVHYYTPEQERADEANFSWSEYYREAGYDDPDLYPYEDEDEPPASSPVPSDPKPVPPSLQGAIDPYSDDIPF